MAKAERVLTEMEIDEQMRLSLKKELLAYIKDAVPYSKKVETMIELWKQVNTQLQIKGAERKRQMQFLLMLPKQLRDKEIKRVTEKMLP
jgi:hypothetical protein